jgi:putative ABC transport system permease protein
MIEDYFIIANRNLNSRKLRSWLTLIGVIISIMIIFLLISLSFGLESAIKEQFRQLGTDKFYIEPKGQIGGSGTGTDTVVNFTKKDSEKVNRMRGIKEATYWALADAKIQNKKIIKYTKVAGIDASSKLFPESGFLRIEEGKLLDKRDIGKIVVGSQFRNYNYLGKDIKLGKKIEIQGVEFRIKGFLKTFGSPPDDRVIYMTIEDFRKVFPEKKDQISMIIAQIKDGEDINNVADMTEKKLRTFRNVDEDDQDFIILTPNELLETINNILNIITGFLLTIAAISLIVGSINIANTMYTSVLERTKEIGIQKAIGAKNSDILKIFSIEAGLIGLGGGIIGVLIGILIAKSIEFYTTNYLGIGLLQVYLSFNLIGGCLLFSFIVGLISGIFPAWGASKIKPAVALRYE